MKKYFSIALAALAASALILSCSKEEAPAVNDPVNPDSGEVTPPSNVITITATLSDATTKVSFTPGVSSGDPILSLTWQASDKLRVADHADNSSYSDFDLVSGQDTNSATFSGTPVSASAYDVWVVHSGASLGSQTQAADGDASHLEYIAMAENVASGDLASVVLDQVSSVLLFTAKNMPAGVAAVIKSVDITAINSDGSPANIFAGDDELSITLTTKGDAGSDNTLMLYATLPVGDQLIAAGTSLLVKFNAPGEDHDVYTRYFTIPSAKTLTHGKLNEFEIGCANIASHAGAATCDGLDDSKAYLIGDKYQMNAIHDLLLGDKTTRYFKMIDDINMSGIEWVPLNNTADGSSEFSKYIHFDGQEHTLSYIATNSTTAPDYPSVFGVMNGTVQNLTIDHATITPGNKKSGVLAGYIGSSDFTGTPSVSNITITNSTVGTSGAKGSNCCGVLCSWMAKAGGTISDITITDCTVAATNYAGGMICEIDATTTISGTNVVKNTDVYGTLAGGVVGFANAQVTMSGCTYTGGDVNATARYAGGMLGSIGNFDSVISNCHVKEATISNTVTSDTRSGGFAGIVNTKVQIKGCTVGEQDNNVTVSLAAPASASSKLNAGGFAGVNYGTITKNGEVRSAAYVNVTCPNKNTGYQLNLGGFIGYHTGTVEYSDANVTMSSLKGTYIGGFIGYMLGSGIARNCTESGTVTGNNYTGGFVGVMDKGSISNCSSAGTLSAQSTIGGFIAGMVAGSFVSATLENNSSSVTVTSSGSNAGGFGGNLAGTYTSNYATGNVSASGGNLGGFAGQILEKGSATLSKNYATGNVSGTTNCGGLIGYVGGTLTMSNCYATGNVGTSSKYNQKYGGLVGFTTDDSSKSDGVTISNCYCTGNVESSFAGGGLIGRIGLASCSVSNCAAWGSSVLAHSVGSSNWSTAGVVGVAFPTCTLTGNYRKPGMAITGYWGTESGYTTQLSATFNHADVSSTHPLTDSTGAEMADVACASGQAHYPQYPYHGHYTSETSLSTLASTTLGWDDEIWDFSGPIPILN